VPRLIVATALLCGSSSAFAQLRANDPKTWVSTSDAPFDGVADIGRNVARIALTISSEGRVFGCKAVYTQPQVKMPLKICDLIMQRARYRSVGTASGQTVEAKDELTLVFNRRALELSNDFGGAQAIDPSGWITHNDYPTDAQRLGQQGLVIFGFGIGDDGRIGNCSVNVSSGYSNLDELTCKLMTRRARFKPPLDEAGRAQATRGRATFVWRINQ
jgi:TonB family protein